MAEATIESLQAEITRLNAQLTASAADLKEANAEARDRRIELRDTKAQLATTATERDQFRSAAAADPEGLKAKVTELSGALRGINHRAAFDTEAKALGVTEPKKLDDLFALSGYKPEADTIDAAALKTTITKALEGRDWLKAPAASGDASGTNTTTTTAAGAATTSAGAHGTTTTTTGAGPGGDRGQSTASTASTSPGRIPGRL